MNPGISDIIGNITNVRNIVILLPLHSYTSILAKIFKMRIMIHMERPLNDPLGIAPGIAATNPFPTSVKLVARQKSQLLSQRNANPPNN